MDAQELRNLQEAYNQVYQVGEGKVELDQERRSRMGRQIGKKIKSAETEYSLSKDTMYPKGLRGAMEKGARKKVGQAQKIMGALKSAQKKKESNRFPNRLRRADGQGIKDSYDYYDIILSHLLDEGYAETPEAAEAIMVNMSEEWRDSIIG